MTASAATLAASAAPRAQRRDGLILLVLVSGGLLYTIGQSLVLPAVGVIARGVHSSHVDATWVLTTYILSGSVAAPTVGRLGDMYGKRRALLCLLSAISLGALLCALSTTLAPMIAGRVLTGASSGIFPLGYAVIRDELPRERIGSAIGLMSVSVGIGTGVGVVFAGVILTGLSYHWLYWFPLIVSVLTTAAAWRWIPESPLRPGGRVDWIGGAMLALGLLTVLLAINEATRWGWGSARTIGLIAGGLVVLLAWVRVEQRTPEPLIDMHTMALKSVWRTNLVATMFGFGMFAAFAVIPQFVEQAPASGTGFGASVILAGIYLFPSTIAMVMIGALAGRIETRFGSKPPLVAGGAFSAVGFALIAVTHGAPVDIYLGTTLAGVGLGLGFAALPSLIVAAVPSEQTGAATAINTISRMLGGAVGVQLCATFIAQSIARRTGLPSDSGFTIAFWICAAGLTGATFIALAIPRGLASIATRAGFDTLAADASAAVSD